MITSFNVSTASNVKPGSSAQRGTNTPGWCHHLISQNNTWQNHWTMTYVYMHFVRSIIVTHRSIVPSMIFIHQIVFKILSWPTNILEVNLCVTWSIIPSMTILSLNSLEDLKQSKVTGPCNIDHWPTYILQVNLCVTMIHYPKHDIPPSNSLEDIKQSHWTKKYRSLTYIYFIRSIFVSHWSIITSMTFLHQTILKHWDSKI